MPRITKRMLRCIPQNAEFGVLNGIGLRRTYRGPVELTLSLPGLRPGTFRRMRFDLERFEFERLIYFVRLMVLETRAEAKRWARKLAEPIPEE